MPLLIERVPVEESEGTWGLSPGVGALKKIKTISETFKTIEIYLDSKKGDYYSRSYKLLNGSLIPFEGYAKLSEDDIKKYNLNKYECSFCSSGTHFPDEEQLSKHIDDVHIWLESLLSPRLRPDDSSSILQS